MAVGGDRGLARGILPRTAARETRAAPKEAQGTGRIVRATRREPLLGFHPSPARHPLAVRASAPESRLSAPRPEGASRWSGPCSWDWSYARF